MNKDKLKKVIEKYRLADPLSETTKKKINAGRKRNLLAVLKKKDRYSVFVLMAVSVMFWFKRMGVTLSLVQSALVVTAAIVVSSAMITTVTVYTVKQYIKKGPAGPADTIENLPEAPGKTGTEQETTKAVKQRSAEKYAAVMVPFQYAPAIEHIGAQVNSSLYNNIRLLKGAGTVLYGRGNGENRNSALRIVGSVVKLGEGYFITAKIVNVKSARIMYHITENAGSAGDIERACSVLAGKLVIHF